MSGGDARSVVLVVDDACLGHLRVPLPSLADVEARADSPRVAVRSWIELGDPPRLVGGERVHRVQDQRLDPRLPGLDARAQ